LTKNQNHNRLDHILQPTRSLAIPVSINSTTAKLTKSEVGERHCQSKTQAEPGETLTLPADQPKRPNSNLPERLPKTVTPLAKT